MERVMVMRAAVGDNIVMHGKVVGQQDQVVTVVEVLGGSDQPLYRVRFDDGHESLMSPGADCVVRSGE